MMSKFSLKMSKTICSFILRILDQRLDRSWLMISISIVSVLYLIVLVSSPLLSSEVKKLVRNEKPPRSM